MKSYQELQFAGHGCEQQIDNPATRSACPHCQTLAGARPSAMMQAPATVERSKISSAWTLICA
jgi:hypothetical protein